MKNIFFGLAFMLVGIFAFANNAEVDTIYKNVTIENLLNFEEGALDEVMLDEEMLCGFTLSWKTNKDNMGSGSTYWNCNGQTWEELISKIFEIFFPSDY